MVKGRIKDGIYEAYISKDEDENISKVYDVPTKDTKKIAIVLKLFNVVEHFL